MAYAHWSEYCRVVCASLESRYRGELPSREPISLFISDWQESDRNADLLKYPLDYSTLYGTANPWHLNATANRPGTGSYFFNKNLLVAWTRAELVVDAEGHTWLTPSQIFVLIFFKYIFNAESVTNHFECRGISFKKSCCKDSCMVVCLSSCIPSIDDNSNKVININKCKSRKKLNALCRFNQQAVWFRKIPYS